MFIIPAIDIMDGECVRLSRGEFASKKVYAKDPARIAKRFEAAGAQMLHIIDLDGAKNGRPMNFAAIQSIRKSLRIPLEVGGGIRSLSDAANYFSTGINRIIIGTKAVKNPRFVADLIKRYGSERIAVGIDIRDGKVATDGWLKKSALSYQKCAALLKKIGVVHCIVTDIARDGMLTAPNTSLSGYFIECGFKVVVSGGVTTIEQLVDIKKSRAFGAVLGKALYEKKIDLKKALKAIQPVSNLTKRIIPCLDVKEGRVVKGIHFVNLRDMGDPVELGKYYSDSLADELVFLDITASKEKRSTAVEMVRRIAQEVFIPFTIGGGIHTVEDIRVLLQNGADKISLNTTAVRNPKLIAASSAAFGAQCIVISIDVKKCGANYKVFIKGGSEETPLEALSWAKKVEALGAGEIMLTSMDRDGTRKGFDTEILRAISSAVSIPVIASGGAGKLSDFKDAVTRGNADAVLAAGIFHSKKYSIEEVKKYLRRNKIPVRL